MLTMKTMFILKLGMWSTQARLGMFQVREILYLSSLRHKYLSLKTSMLRLLCDMKICLMWKIPWSVNWQLGGKSQILSYSELLPQLHLERQILFKSMKKLWLDLARDMTMQWFDWNNWQGWVRMILIQDQANNVKPQEPKDFFLKSQITIQ